MTPAGTSTRLASRIYGKKIHTHTHTAENLPITTSRIVQESFIYGTFFRLVSYAASDQTVDIRVDSRHQTAQQCVFSPHSFWTPSSLDVPAGVTQEEGHTGFIIHLLSAVRALIFTVDGAYRFGISGTQH